MSDDNDNGIKRAIDAAEVLSDGSDSPAPSEQDHAPPLPPHDASDEADDPGEVEAGPDLDWDLLRACEREPQNDIGNSRRLRHRFGDSLLHVQNVAYFAWDSKRWKEDTDLKTTRPLCHLTSELIALEPLVMMPTEAEQALIDAAEESLLALDDAQTRLNQLLDEELKPAERKKREQAIKREIEPLKDAVAAGRQAKASLNERRSKRRRYAVSSGNSGKLTGMLNEAMPYFSKPLDEMDVDALALNVGNGTIRYERHPDAPAQWRPVLSPHAKGDYITKIADVDYDPEAKCPKFTEFLATVMPSEPIRLFLQRYFGYAATALTREQVFVLCHGEGRNGKSTLIDLIAKVLGDYSQSVPVSTLVNDARGGKGSEATPDLAKLPGARLVRCAEPKEGIAFDESLIKGLTSGEPLPVRRLNQEFIDIYPTFKLIISANRKPTIRGNDDGIWRRVLMVPFDVQIAEDQVDKQLSSKLWDERSGILNWILEGACNYFELGALAAPEEIRDATLEYREESDIVGAYVRAALNVTKDPTDQIETGKLYESFIIFCKRQGTTPLAGSTFNRRLPRAAHQFGFEKGRSSISLYSGISFNEGFDPSAHRSARVSHDEEGSHAPY